MKEEILPDAESVARRGAAHVAASAREAIGARGRFLLAVSGGSTPERMFEELSHLDLDWSRVHLFQVDERAAPAGHAARNLAQLERALLTRLPRRPVMHAMPVEHERLEEAAAMYAATLTQEAGDPPHLDLVHLGIGEDGHTASLIPGEPAVSEQRALVATTGNYGGYRRLTLTRPVLDQARAILWIVTGAAKAEALRRLRDGDRTIPAGLVARSQAVLLADREAGGLELRS